MCIRGANSTSTTTHRELQVSTLHHIPSRATPLQAWTTPPVRTHALSSCHQKHCPVRTSQVSGISTLKPQDQAQDASVTRLRLIPVQWSHLST